ncbi:peptidoglycan recognition protein family protein [Streptomyces sp. NBC_01264]|uniref:peptidoglycan recognition protein family protein n=1 Tax=Streptomyces sp. NBC_01264 TaxID=2903804 RepID=UPI0022567356|nr:N-acetylmuramoyl-L-alanine amidase [Streptomyces sp. NBC_01264]MCX4779934.1 N-acetylmuramoyl-L-alanine amidase [Streptomyces sp. NBC_01264]
MTAFDRPGPHPRRRAVLTGTLAVGAAALLPLATPGRARAATGPVIADCATWGARQPSGSVRTLPTPPQKIIVHHTATPNVTDYSQSHAFDLARSMQAYQMDDERWIDTGQHFTISRGAHVVEGRHGSLAALQAGTRHVESAHCSGQNTVAVGIENEGTYSTVDPRSAQFSALVDLCAHICRQYGLAAYQIYGHRDFNSTACPGDRLYALLPQLRRDVAARIGGDPAAPVWPVLRSGDNGERVRTLQQLLIGRGAGLTADGAFGPATDAAVRDFQAAGRATADGIAGPQTWNQLVAPARRGDSGEAVKAVQGQLTAHGIATAVDGAFGPGTEAGVVRFQGTRSLPADGIVDARTWSRLVV